MKKLVVFVFMICGCSNFLGRANYYTCPTTQCSNGQCCECDCDVAKGKAVDMMLCSATSQDDCLNQCEAHCK